MTSPRGLFVTGTDTGVGKTLVTCGIVKSLRMLGVDAAGFKPVASGSIDGQWADAESLRLISGPGLTIEQLCPLRFHAPKAPTIAAREENRTVDLELAYTRLAELQRLRSCVIVEGVGGLLVPLDEQTLILDFARKIALPILLVCRAGLGTINHTLLTVREIQRAGHPLAGVIMNVTQKNDTAVAGETCAEIERLTGLKILTVMPYLPELDSDYSATNFESASYILRRAIDIRALAGV